MPHNSFSSVKRKSAKAAFTPTLCLWAEEEQQRRITAFSPSGEKRKSGVWCDDGTFFGRVGAMTYKSTSALAKVRKNVICPDEVTFPTPRGPYVKAHELGGLRAFPYSLNKAPVPRDFHAKNAGCCSCQAYKAFLLFREPC